MQLPTPQDLQSYRQPATNYHVSASTSPAIAPRSPAVPSVGTPVFHTCPRADLARSLSSRSWQQPGKYVNTRTRLATGAGQVINRSSRHARFIQQPSTTLTCRFESEGKQDHQQGRTGHDQVFQARRYHREPCLHPKSVSSGCPAGPAEQGDEQVRNRC
jgi:hypothetical protein